jgi:hypothetical protein
MVFNKKHIDLLYFVTLNTIIIFAWINVSFANTNHFRKNNQSLRPQSSFRSGVEASDLDIALPSGSELAAATAEIVQWKTENQGVLSQRSTGNPFITLLQEQAEKIYYKHRLYELPFDDRLRFCDIVFDDITYPTVNEAVNLLYGDLEIENRSLTAISPEKYYQLAAMLSETEYKYSVSENHYIRFCFSLILDFWDFERRILEQIYIVEQIDRELAKPGTGQLPLIAAMQDLHGGARRALSLAGFVLGLTPDIYTRVQTLEDLQKALREHGIDITDKDIRFIGLNDKYDRGDDPCEVFRFVRWLRDAGKAKPFIGNHDFWRTISVLGIHLLPEDLRIDFEKTHGIGYWSRDAFAHSGWGDIELERVNERRFNQALISVNRTLRQHGLEELEPVDLAAVRIRFAAELKALKRQNAEIRKQNELSKDDPAYQRQSEHPLPNILHETLSHLRQKRAECNVFIDEVNEQYFYNVPRVDFTEVNLENYWQDQEIIDAALWELKNFRLFYVDILGNLHMHNILPIDYQGGGFAVEYKGLKGLPALELMAEEVRIFFEGTDTIPDSMDFRYKAWKELGDIFNIINSWYSDKTAYAKAVSVKQFIDAGGLEDLGHEIIGHIEQSFVDREPSFLVFWGHNERKKFSDSNINMPWLHLYPGSKSGIANIDYELSTGYSDRGAIVTFLLRDSKGSITGLRKWGYRNGSKVIEDLTFEDTASLSDQQKDMLVNLTDGVTFLRWYREQAIIHILEGANLLRLIAERQGRGDKIYHAQRIINRFEKASDDSTTGLMVFLEGANKIVSCIKQAA